MKKLGLMSLIASAMLFMAFGATSLSAVEGMGKCGNSQGKMMDDEKMKKGKCGAKKSDGKCGKNKEMKKDGKCGKEKEAKKSMKCGAGKCGS